MEIQKTHCQIDTQKNIRIKYPKTGTTNPSIKINVFDDLTSNTPSELNVEAPVDLGTLNFQYLILVFCNNSPKLGKLRQQIIS